MSQPAFTLQPMVLALSAVFFGLSGNTTQAAELPPLVVTGQTTSTLQQQITPDSSPVPSADAGDWLRQQPGIDANRMGGHGLDPVIRGQGQNRLNVLLDGAYVFGGCPNRMDPPTAYAALSSYDLITISKGVTTLRHGAGGSGGTVVFERTKPDFLPDDPAISGQLGSSYASNGDAFKIWGKTLAGNQQGYLRAFGEYSEAGNYEDGKGRSIWSGYETTQGGMALGWTPNTTSWLELSIEETRERDVKFAGAGMDSPTSDNTTLGLRGRYDWSPLLTLSGNLHYSQVEHVMDNFTYRPATATAMKMTVPTTSDTLTARLMGEYQLGRNLFTTGINLLQNERSGTLTNAANPNNLLEIAYMWPDVTQRQLGAFAEIEHSIGVHQRAFAGLRVDQFNSKADTATDKPVGPAWTKSPADLYQQAYGISGDLDRDEWLTGAFIRMEQDFSNWQRAFVSLSRSQRMGDASEMYMARNASMGNVQWIGNPDLKPETQHQLDVGLLGKSAAIDYSAVVFANQIQDYIYRDKIIDGSITRDYYRNIRAAHYGVELETTLRYAEVWETRAQLTAMRGDNRSDGGTLAQISPYSGQISQHWITHNWEASSTLRFAAESDRLNAPAAEQATSGYGVVDLALIWRPVSSLEVATGISNLLDKNYSNFINRNRAANDPLNIGTDQYTDTLSEPGRSIWVSGNYRF